MQIILLIWFVLLPATSYAGPMQASNFGSEIERPNFSEIQDVQTKKSAFFDYLMPYVLEANAGIKAERSIVLQFEAMNGAGQALTPTPTGGSFKPCQAVSVTDGATKSPNQSGHSPSA